MVNKDDTVSDDNKKASNQNNQANSMLYRLVSSPVLANNADTEMKNTLFQGILTRYIVYLIDLNFKMIVGSRHNLRFGTSTESIRTNARLHKKPIKWNSFLHFHFTQFYHVSGSQIFYIFQVGG